MRVLGVDPGLGRCGWAVLEGRGGRVVAAGYGTVHTDGEQVAPRLLTLAARLRQVWPPTGPRPWPSSGCSSTPTCARP